MIHSQRLYVQNVAQISLASGATKSILVAVLALLYVLYTRYATPLCKIPGPFLASITKLWVVQQTRSFNRHNVDIELHKKYGTMVRVAPNEVMVSDLDAMRTIYGAAKSYHKGDWYKGSSRTAGVAPDELNFFSDNDLEKIRVQRRAVGPAYTAEAMKDHEHTMNFVMGKHVKLMRERSGEAVDIDIFCNMFILDCVAMITYSKEKRLVEAGQDDGVIRAIHDMWFYIIMAGYFPLLHLVIVRVSQWLKLEWQMMFRKAVARFDRTAKVKPKQPFAFAQEAIQERFARRNDPSSAHSKIHETDIMARLLLLQSEKGVLTDKWIASMTLTNFGAGVETTAGTVSVLINNIVRRGLLERVHQEIDAARREGNLSNPPRPGEMKQHLPFLSACLKESMRLFPLVGMPLVRTVSKAGLELEGYYLPPGTQVGMNPWVINRDVSLYGEDADEWRPERWLECTPEQLRRLESLNLNFGGGLRSCPGKNLAEAIYSKMIPILLGDFDWSLARPEKEPFMRGTFTVRLVEEMMVYKHRG
ncbi:cytochrome P450 [Hyaloscypha variabilis F]|uniref:Cytochrome P450 n=1 Tax=Hyaloscypha variabilis (strain UAMH 11265 / GT02V1 / F) TaxID=1149755 RepID=A0A2J6RI20_HYAVF|nr:cytochrome P450 [Hyaloscypha variabilis F]